MQNYRRVKVLPCKLDPSCKSDALSKIDAMQKCLNAKVIFRAYKIPTRYFMISSNISFHKSYTNNLKQLKIEKDVNKKL